MAQTIPIPPIPQPYCSTGEDRAPLHAGAAMPCIPGWDCRVRPGCGALCGVAERALGGPGTRSAADVRELHRRAPVHLTVVLEASGVSFQTLSYILGSCRCQRNELQMLLSLYISSKKKILF